MKNFLIITIAISAIASASRAQTQAVSGGIHFEQNLKWSDILAKAKAEHKYIFVDCYATWCEPCKLMETTIYPQKAVGAIYNQDFICLKMQMDKTKSDDSVTKSRYTVAEMLEKDYTIDAYPTFLFFDPNGNPVHKVSGGLNIIAFIQLAADAQNPNKQYYAILKNFRPGKQDTAEEKQLILAFANSDAIFAGKIAVDYLTRIPKSQWRKPENCRFMDLFRENIQIHAIAQKYIKAIKQNDRYDPSILRFITHLTFTVNDAGFGFFYDNVGHIDSVMKNKQYAQDHIDYCISNTEWKPMLKRAQSSGYTPDFEQLAKTISRNYNSTYANTVAIEARIQWYNYVVLEKKLDSFWPELSRALLDRNKRYLADKTAVSPFDVNDACWNAYLHNSDPAMLSMADSLMAQLVKDSPQDFNAFDTYASLLYKSGKKDKAIATEELALTKFDTIRHPIVAAGYRSKIEAMKKNEKIWLNPAFQN